MEAWVNVFNGAAILLSCFAAGMAAANKDGITCAWGLVVAGINLAFRIGHGNF